MKKSVLFIAHHLTIGGSQKSLIDALNALDYEKYDVTLYIRKPRLDLLERVNKNVDVIINDDKTHYYRNPLVLFCGFFSKRRQGAMIRKKMLDYELERFFKNKRFDIAISYFQGYTSDILPFINADKRIMFFHSSVDEEHEFHKELFLSLDGIVGVNRQVADMLKIAYPDASAKISFIDNYTDYEYILRQSREFAIPKIRTTLCTVGRMVEVKGFHMAVEAARILRDKGFDYQWYFVGDGPERGVVEALAKDYKLQERIIFTGMQSNPYPYINLADIYVQPSIEESYGLSIAEAKSLCIPIVSTKTVGGNIQISDGFDGILTAVNPLALADGIIKLLNDPRLVNSIVNELKKVDYSTDKGRYRRDWAQLLEE